VRSKGVSKVGHERNQKGDKKKRWGNNRYRENDERCQGRGIIGDLRLLGRYSAHTVLTVGQVGGVEGGGVSG
jgi:hypothetical protein